MLRFIKSGEGFFEELILAAHAVQRAACEPYRAYASHSASLHRGGDPRDSLTAFRHEAIRSFPATETIRSFRTGHGRRFREHHFRTLALYRSAALGGWQLQVCRWEIFCLLPSPTALRIHLSAAWRDG